VTEDIEQPIVSRKGSQSVDSNLKMDLYNAMAILSESERSCITLQLIEGQPIDKISEITGMAPGTVKSHLFRGKQKLATYLRSNGYD
jgi:RNA polymerase sigma-70 factor (ECF subfamily)